MKRSRPWKPSAPSRPSLSTSSARGVREEGVPKGKGTARRCLIVWSALGRASRQPNDMIDPGSKTPGTAKCSKSTEIVGPHSLPPGRSICCRHTDKETDPPFLSSSTTKRRDVLEGTLHSCCPEAPQLRRTRTVRRKNAGRSCGPRKALTRVGSRMESDRENPMNDRHKKGTKTRSTSTACTAKSYYIHSSSSFSSSPPSSSIHPRPRHRLRPRLLPPPPAPPPRPRPPPRPIPRHPHRPRPLVARVVAPPPLARTRPRRRHHCSNWLSSAQIAAPRNGHFLAARWTGEMGPKGSIFCGHG